MPDIIVIGGGMAGVSAAAALAADAEVLLLEAEPGTGQHSTARSAAIFIRNYGNAALRALNDRAAGFFEAPDIDVEAPLLTPRGELLLATGEELDLLEEYAAGSAGLERLSAAEAERLVPILKPGHFAGAVLEPEARDIDVDAMLQGYLRQFRARGGQLRCKAPVSALSREAGLWQIVAGGETHAAPVVVNAAGAWAGEIARMAGAQPIPIQPCRRSAAVLPAPEGHEVGLWPLFGSIAETWYAKPMGGQLMVSPADADPVPPQDAWPDDMVLAEGLHRYESAVTVPVTRMVSSCAGLRSFAPDKTPVCGFDAEVEGFFWLAGQGGHGIQTAPALAELTAALVTGGAALIDDASLGALAPARFG
jgi:D-arginine dehydrogenase